MANSRDELLTLMAGGSVTYGWGAICVFNRARLNYLLQQQFVAGFNELSFLPAFSGRVYLTEEKTAWADLDSIFLTKPLLSFETASLDNSRARLTLYVASGSYTLSQDAVGMPPVLLSSFKLSEQQGFTLTIDINLSLVFGQVDNRGRVVLDISDGLNFSCNLVNEEYGQKLIGKLLEERFKALPAHKRVFNLGMLDFNGYSPLTPTRFYIRTQAAPGAKNVKASNYGEGGVVVLIRVKGNTGDGVFPSESSGFPYLIPDDRDALGNDLYSASVVVSREFIQDVKPGSLTLLSSLLFPGENAFVEESRYSPYDLVAFGNIDPTLTSITLDPLFSVIKAGSDLRFNVVQAGKMINAIDVNWRVRSINTIQSAGDIVQGVYKSVTQERLGRESVRNVVTASYTDPGTNIKHSASALVLVAYEGVAIAPLVSVSSPRGEPITLKVSTVSGGVLRGSLLDPTLGSLVFNVDTAIYTPPDTLPNNAAVQRIQVQDTQTGETVQSTVLLIKTPPTLEVTPPYASGVSHSEEVQLTNSWGAFVNARKDHPGFLRILLAAGIEEQWRIVSGEGNVNAAGLFTAPAHLTTPVSVVACDIVFEGISFYTGYSIIQLSDFAAEPSWDKLVNFKLTAPSGNTRAFANGYQQIAIDVEIETEPVNGKDYPLTEEELSSLTIVHRTSGQNLKYLNSGQEGIEADADGQWAVSNDANRFNRSDSVTQAVDEKSFEILNGISRRRVYVHTRAADPEIFNARFIAADFGQHNSNEKSNLPPYTIELVPLVVPSFTPAHYDFKPKRVAGGGKNPPGQDDYDYYPRTTDYWSLDYRGVDGRAVRFVRLELEGNQSVVQWESRFQNELMFTYTGYIFNDEKVKGDEKTMCYDERMSPVVTPYNHPLDYNIIATEVVGEGQLMIGLFRTDDIRYWSDSQLEIPLLLKLLDKNGNFHRLSIGFAPMAVVDSRNTLLLAVL